MYEKFFGWLGFAIFVTVFGPMIAPFFGALAGWIVSLFFGDTILIVLRRFGVDIDGLTMWQLGATLGFVGGYLKTTVHQKGA